jgi:hypothetical protein
MYVLVGAELRRSRGSSPVLWRVLEDLESRKQVGIERYGEPLKAHNNRDALRDLNEELLDALVYVMQNIQEADPGDGVALGRLAMVYDNVVHALFEVTKIRAEREAEQPE